ncbi:MAG: MFS transporter [bacterium]|nr:MFS transporter [bacterium]
MDKHSSKIAFCGFCAFFTSLGITLFAYPVLLPYVIQENWISEDTANIILNFDELGFIIGLISTAFLHKILSWKNILRYSLLLSAISLACPPLFSNSYGLSISILFMSFISGVIVTSAPPYLLSTVSNNNKSFVAGIMYSGTGVGFIITSIFIDLLINHGLHYVWHAFSILIFILTIVSWFLWPVEQKVEEKKQIGPKKSKQQKLQYIKTIVFTCILFEIGTSAIILYLEEYLYIYKKFSSHETSLAWLLVGIGSILGTLIFGYLSKYIGVKYTYMITTLLAGSSTMALGFISMQGIILLLTLAGSLGIYAGVAMYAAYNNLVNSGKFSLLSWQIIIFAETVSAWLAVLLFGYLLRYDVNYFIIFIICGILLIFALLVTILLPNIKNQKSESCTQ